MPTYSYQCQKCETVLNVFHSMSATPRISCEQCGSRRMKRLIGSGAGIIFKGSGFYQTDYKNGSQKKSDESKGSDSKSESKSESKSDSKSESKPETKTAAKSESKSSSSKEAGSGSAA